MLFLNFPCNNLLLASSLLNVTGCSKVALKICNFLLLKIALLSSFSISIFLIRRRFSISSSESFLNFPTCSKFGWSIGSEKMPFEKKYLLSFNQKNWHFFTCVIFIISFSTCSCFWNFYFSIVLILSLSCKESIPFA